MCKSPEDSGAGAEEKRKSAVRDEADKQGQVAWGLIATSEMGAIQCIVGSLCRLRGWRGTSWGRKTSDVDARVIQAVDGGGSDEGGQGEGEKCLDSRDVF